MITEKLLVKANDHVICHLTSNDLQMTGHLSFSHLRSFRSLAITASDRNILANFVKACSLLTCRIINIDMLSQAHNRLLQVALLIEENYGQEFITPNIHLSFHITDCCKDYGPLYSFWCYSFERINGLLGNKLFLLFLCLCLNLPYWPKNIPYCFL